MPTAAVIPRGSGAIDCDVHHAVAAISDLFPYLPQRWQDYCVEHGVTSLAPALYPARAPLSASPRSRAGGAPPATAPRTLGADVFGDGAGIAILNCLYAVQAIHNEDWAVAMASALNDWTAAEWLSADPRFRASIVVPTQDPVRAAAEIERLAASPGFVQVLLMARSQSPLGKRAYWPIYDAAVAAGLPVAIHPGVAGGNAPTPAGWPSTYVEDYAATSLAMQSQVTSLVCEGVFQQYPSLRVVLLESGVTWLPPMMWRLDKNWKGLRREVPWLSEPPSRVIREHIRLSTQPFDGRSGNEEWLARFLGQLGSADMLLYSSDYPHWHACGPAGQFLGHLDEIARRKVQRDNALATYQLSGERDAT
jgi:predicted TIM-barrel fold metal-dependent hydrolase